MQKHEHHHEHHDDQSNHDHYGHGAHKEKESHGEHSHQEHHKMMVENIRDGDIVLVRDNPEDVVNLIRLSKASYGKWCRTFSGQRGIM